MKLLIFLPVFLLIGNAFCSDYKFKVRAREHFEKLSFDKGPQYSGFTHRFNFWMEKPMDISYGIGFGPFWAPLKGPNREESVTLYNLGFEVKKYPNKDIFFIRPAIYLNKFKNYKSNIGASIYLGGGVEVKKWGIGFALELSAQMGYLDGPGLFYALGPALGVHFYDYI